jgi:uncharacterized protein YecE (DUF72 family)
MTHRARFYAAELWLTRMSRGLRYLVGKRGVLLVQTPPDMVYDHACLAYFLRQIPQWPQIVVKFRHPSLYRKRCSRCWSDTALRTA